MPELPEVETIRRDLEAALLKKTIESVFVKDPSALTGIGPAGKPRRNVTPLLFANQVSNKIISRFDRRGKYLVMEFGDGTAIIFHLRMTGQLLLNPPAYKERIMFNFTDGHKLYFSDRRRFGEAVYVERWREDSAIRALGVEPTEKNLTGEYLKKVFDGRKTPVHSALLNQSLVSGLGNIYVTEALYDSGIRPLKHAGKIPAQKLETLAASINKIIKKSIEHRGYSMNTYVDAMGKKGRSQMFSRAYGKEGLPCPKCGTIFRRAVITGRGVVFCPKCQP